MTEPARPGSPDLDADAVIDHHVTQLRRRREQLDHELDGHRRHLSATLAALRHVRGRGTAEDEAVVVVVDAHHRMVDLELDPRALRLGSIARLRRALLTASRAASEDADRQLGEAGAEGEGAGPDLLSGLMDRMPEVTAMVGTELFTLPGPDADAGQDPSETSHPGTPNPFD